MIKNRYCHRINIVLLMLISMMILVSYNVSYGAMSDNTKLANVLLNTDTFIMKEGGSLIKDNNLIRSSNLSSPMADDDGNDRLSFSPNISQPAPPPGWALIKAESFDGVFPNAGWSIYDAGNGTPTWDEDDCLPHEGPNSAWCADIGANPDLDPCTGTYVNNMYSWMVYGPFDLSDTSEAYMKFMYQVDTEASYDWLWWGASNDDNVYTNIYGASGYSGSGWTEGNYDLTSFCGDSSVWIAFIFESDSSIIGGTLPYTGAFVDTIEIAKKTTIETVDIPMCFGWNMISIPGTPVDPNVANIVAGTPVLPVFYTYSGGAYIPVTTVEHGPAYWAATTEPYTLSIDYTSYSTANVPLIFGWNMVGSVDCTVPVSSLTSVPSNHLPVAYTYDCNTSAYVTVANLMPGKGHWIAATDTCTLTINCVSPSPPSSDIYAITKSIQPTWQSTLTVSSQGHQQKLVFGSHSSASSSFDVMIDRMIPPPLPDMFLSNDFGNGIIKAGWTMENTEFPFLNASYVGKDDPLVWHLSLELSASGILSISGLPSIYNCILYEDGHTQELHGTFELSSGVHNITLFLLPIETKPEKTELLSNYPNPFNPETWIPYRLSESSEVVVMIHDMSGKEVRRLNLGNQPSGDYIDKSRAIYWDGKNSAGENVVSGVYFYSITAGKFSATRKMIVQK